MVPKGGISGFLWIEFVVRWSLICPMGSVFETGPEGPELED